MTGTVTHDPVTGAWVCVVQFGYGAITQSIAAPSPYSDRAELRAALWLAITPLIARLGLKSAEIAVFAAPYRQIDRLVVRRGRSPSTEGDQ